MRNEIIDKVIDEVVNGSSESDEFKMAMKQFIMNKFDGNASEGDFNTVISLIRETGGNADANDNN